jgi:Trk-type K+ transport system membrane component
VVARCVALPATVSAIRDADLSSVPGLALWLICIIERGQINNPENEATFNIFNIIFELISGYGTVGLSLGVANVSCIDLRGMLSSG